MFLILSQNRSEFGWYYNKVMIELSIPGIGIVRLEHLVCDVNGTIALDGKLIDGVSRAVGLLRDRISIHILTADTYGRQEIIDQQLNLTAFRLQKGPDTRPEAQQKADFVQELGSEHVIAIGQGANDALMLQTAKVGVCVLSQEGTAVETLLSADLLVPNILNALELLEKPLRLVATLRK